MKIIDNESENQKLIELTRALRMEIRNKHDAEAVNLLHLVLEHITAYEQHHYPVAKSKPEDMLKFLMDQHQLTQNDLPEIGARSVVSKILSGKRPLAADEIKLLSKRFHVPSTVFQE